MGKLFFSRFVVFGVCIIFAASPAFAAEKTVSIVPQPVSMTVDEGFFVLKPNTAIVSDRDTQPLAKQLRAMLEPATGHNLEIKTAQTQTENAINIKLNPSLSSLGQEGYKLRVTGSKVSIEAVGQAGVFYGFQTLLQLLPPEIFSQAKVSGIEWKIPCVQIEDYPRFQWRGLHLDTGRYFLPKEFIKKYIDLIALHKMNVFHWHLTEDQGWRIEIKKYPKLTDVGAWRKETLIGHYSRKPHEFDGAVHGGFYTQDDIRQIVEYARQRFVTVVPEIEMPGHSQAAVASYPELGNTDKPVEVSTIWGVHENTFNVNEETIKFLQDVLDEVLELFPGRFIHIGGDEAPKKQWKQSPQAQAKMKELGLKDEEELQSWFIKRMEKYLSSKGRRLIGWDEILEGGLAPGATVMSWRGEKGGITAAKSGHDVVMAPTGYTYFDFYQAEAKTEPLAIGGLLPLQKVYGYNPVPAELTEEEAKHILGAQAQLWTEYIPNPKKAEYMAYPRACALSEAVWTPMDRKNYGDFRNRLETHLRRLDFLDVNYRKLDAEPTVIGEWKKGQTSEEFRTVTFDISRYLTGSSDYDITFSYTDGEHRLDIEWVEILQNDKTITRREQAGITGGKNE
ncbi:MAG: beta-N-acetylhexosaminidase, partial [Planctomycetota bacterium]|nr:beta-N-acetylhexosaminidase [Planctomycetota bacterium]